MKIAFLGLAVVLASSPVAVRSAPSPLASSAVAGTITRAQFTSAIKDREPTDSLTKVGADKAEVYFFTDLKGFAGSKITHRWEHGGKVVLERTFDVAADRWRAWSNKGLGRTTGEWKVVVVDGSGATLGTYTLTAGK
jgi:hypothetical protein